MEINILAQNLFRTFHQYAYNSLIRLFYFYLKFLDKYINIVIAHNLLYMCIYIYILYIYIYVCVCVFLHDMLISIITIIILCISLEGLLLLNVISRYVTYAS